MAAPKQPGIEQMMAELRDRAVGPKQPVDPIGTAKRNLSGMYESAKRIPGNVKRMVQDPVAYAKSIPAPTGDQIMNALGPGNVGMAGIMIGPKAKTWDAERAYKAVMLEHAGVKPEQIWYATGTYRGPGGAWRQEIDDSKAVHRTPDEIKGKARQLQDQQAMLKAAARESLSRGKEVVSDLFPKEAVAARQAIKKQVSNIDDELGGYFGLKADPRRGNLMKYGYEHPELYAAYPELADYVMAQGKKGDAGVLGSMSGKDLELYQAGLNQKQPSSTVAHELQHAIQGIEGTPRGGNTYEFMRARQHAEDMVKTHNTTLSDLAKRIDEAQNPFVKKQLQDRYFDEMTLKQKVYPSSLMDPYQEYRLLGGEAESRMIQERLNMPQEQRSKTFPMGSYDVNPKHLRLLDKNEAIDIYKADGGEVRSGLDKFLAPSKVKERLYHATPEDFKEFKAGGKDPSISGHAIWLSKDPERQPAAHNTQNRSGFREGVRVMPVHVQTKTPMVLDSKDMLAWAQAAFADGSREFPELMPKEWADAVKSEGYDSIIHADPHGRGDPHEIIMFHPNKIKSALGNRGTYDLDNPDINMAEGGTAKTPSIAQMKLALNKHGMYSPLEKAAMAVPRTKGTHAEFMAEIAKQPGFRKEEVADRKIPEAEGKMTKEDFLAHLKKHSVPPLQEKIIGGDDNDEDDGTQYDDYQLPGGSNYREVLLKTPSFPESKNMQIMELESNIRRMDPADYPPGYVQNMIDGVAKLKAEKAAVGENYNSSHWRDDPNVLAHIRLSDRYAGDTGKFAVEGTKNGKTRVLFSTGINGTQEQAREAAKRWQNEGYQTNINQVGGGKKLLHVEEIQSDWHQSGRKKGYHDLDKLAQSRQEIDALKAEHKRLGEVKASAATPEEREAISEQRLAIMGKIRDATILPSDHVPDAPFKKSWHELAMKHVLHHAAANGYDGVVITPGDEQAKRWNDEGLRVQYDSKLPEFLNKFGKPFGAQVGQMPLEHGSKAPSYGMPSMAEFEQNRTPDETMAQYIDRMKAVPNVTQLHHFPITDQMRQTILQNGLPQYKRGGIIHKAEGGNVATLEQMKAQLMAKRPLGLSQLQSVGANEAPNLAIKAYMPPGGREEGSTMPIGGVDMNMQPGHQLLPQGAMPPQQPQGMPGAPGMPPMGAAPGGPPPGGAPAPQQPGGSNILQMTPQGQAMAAMSGGRPPMAPPRPMADGGSMSDKSTDDMKDEMQEKDPGTRLKIDAEGPGGVKGIVVPHHMLHGRSWVSAKTGKTVVVPGMNEINKARAQVYGFENRDPMGINEVGSLHKKTLAEHFAKPHKQQLADEKEALGRLRAAKHIHGGADTLDKSEKLDTVNHEYDEQGRSFTGLASKGVAGHALYTSGHGENEKRHVLNTCPGQTAGCGGGTDKDGIVDTSKGTCFAPNAESQYVHAAVRRACHEQAKHDPAMTKDWILAHTGALREAARKADRVNKRLLFRPNVVDETDVSSRHVIRHLNEQRKEVDKPPIVANSYGKTTELHDPENGYYVTHSNVGPKVKKGASIAENIARDQQRVRQTILGTKNKKGDDLVNAQGNVTPPKGSYMVTDVKRYSPFDKKMQGAITHAKYWSTGRAEHELSKDEKGEGEEGHFDGNGKPTTPDKAHYGHTTTTDDKGNKLRYDYQKQHILHPRLVNVPERKKNKKTGQMETVDHMIPTDSRFKDEDYLPKDRYKTKTGKLAGHILMTTPTESTDNVGHQTSFTHHVGEHHIEHAQKNNGEYEIDHPKDQEASHGTEYVTPQPIKIMKKLAKGGSVNTGTDEEMDGHMAFPERSFGAQHRLSYRHDPEEAKEIGHLPYDAGAKNIQTIHGRLPQSKVTVHKDLDTMAYELSRKTKAK
jgi:hypothetical protein